MTHQSERSEELEMPELRAFRSKLDVRVGQASPEEPGETLKMFGMYIEFVDLFAEITDNSELGQLGRVAVLKEVENWVRGELLTTAQTAHRDGISWGAISRAARVAPSTGKARWSPTGPETHAVKVRRQRRRQT